MSEADLYKFFSSYDGEADFSDFSPEELAALLGRKEEERYKEKYFSYYDDVKSKT